MNVWKYIAALTIVQCTCFADRLLIRSKDPEFLSAHVDTELHRATDVRFVVKPSDMKPGPRQAKFHSHPGHADFVLEYDDYARTGYDAGHLRSDACSKGSRFVNDSSDMDVVVPMTPDCNRLMYRAVERKIEELARSGTDVYVTVAVISSGRQMVFNGEAFDVPESFVVSMEWIVDDIGRVARETYRIPNTKAPTDWSLDSFRCKELHGLSR